jgi:hypothetical protein
MTQIRSSAIGCAFAEPRQVMGRFEWREQDNAIARTIFIASSLATTGSCVGAFSTSAWWLAIISCFLAIGVPVAVGLLAFRGRTKPSKLKFRVNPDTRALEVARGEQLLILKHEELASAWIVSRRFVHIRSTGNRSLVLDLGDEATAAELISELGLGKEHRVLDMPLAGFVKTLDGQRFAALSLLPLSFVWAVSALLVATGLGKLQDGMDLVLLSGFLATLLLSLGGSIALVNDLRERKVVVGTDGIRIPHKKNALRYDQIASVSPSATGVRIVKTDGAFVDLPLFSDGGYPFESLQDAQHALISRIEEMRTQGEKTAAEQKFALLERTSVSLAEWQKQLRALAEPRTGYRVAQLTAEDLERVIGDSESPVDRRVAATVALSGLDKERAMDKVRVVIPTCADDDLKRALVHAAEEAAFDQEFMDESAPLLKQRR